MGFVDEDECRLAEHLAAWLAPFTRPRLDELVSEPSRCDAGEMRPQLSDERR